MSIVFTAIGIVSFVAVVYRFAVRTSYKSAARNASPH